jgi:hypothetical protein
MSKWTVEVIGQAKKAKDCLPDNIKAALTLLIDDLKKRPDPYNWPNFSKLSKYHYHCHLKKGKPTYVACWSVNKEEKLVEVYYAGTHEKAPY